MTFDFETHGRSDVRRLQILDAMERLLDDIAFEKLTVKAICERAGIDRRTFYDYFDDKYAAIIWYWERLVGEPLKEAGRTLPYYDAAQKAYENLEGHHALLSKATDLSEAKYQDLIPSVVRTYESWLRETVTEWHGLPMTNRLDVEVQIFAVGVTHLSVQWMLDGMAIPPEEMARYVDGSVPAHLHELLSSTATSNDSGQ